MRISTSEINQLLIQSDIEGFIAAGAPLDEYIDEAAQITAAISANKEHFTIDMLTAMISLVWIRCFELSAADMKLRASAVERLARRIHAVLSA